MNKIKVFETFAGIGAQRKALQLLQEKGFLEYEIVATSEWDIWANISYNAIHFDNDTTISKGKTIEEMLEFLSHFTHSSNSKDPIKIKSLYRMKNEVITKLYSSYKNSNNLGSINYISANDIISKSKEGIDMITYSFPCQDLSTAGKNKGMSFEKQTRSGLLWEIDRILQELKSLNKLPKYLLLENVKNMIQSKHKNDYITWIERINSCYGYNTKTFVLDSNEFGIPQKRSRVYALSMREEEGFKDQFSTDGKITSNNNYITNLYNEDKIEWKTKSLKNLLRMKYVNPTYKEEAINSIPNNTPSRRKMRLENTILFPNETILYTRTVTTKQDRHPNSGIILIEKKDFTEIFKNSLVEKSDYRFLTPRETFLLMGFSESDYDKIVKHNSFIKKEKLYRQAGNSIVVNVLVVLIYNIIKNEWKEK